MRLCELCADNPLYFLLHDEPNPEMTSFVFRKTFMPTFCCGATAMHRLYEMASSMWTDCSVAIMQAVWAVMPRQGRTAGWVQMTSVNLRTLTAVYLWLILWSVVEPQAFLAEKYLKTHREDATPQRIYREECNHHILLLLSATLYQNLFAIIVVFLPIMAYNRFKQ